MKYWHWSSPIGPLLLLADQHGLRQLGFAEDRRQLTLPADAQRDESVLAPYVDQLAEYFAGQRQAFSLPLAPLVTDFQARVLQQLQLIDHGRTLSYGELASILGKPQAARAVGMACASNPLPIVIPCHRVLGAGGRMTGYVGGLERKRWLLAHESAPAISQAESRP